jgi:uncharacterized membrane protein YkvA (DUF1232 family)
MTDMSQDETDLQKHERTVSRGFWPKLRRFAANLPFAEEAVAAYYAAFDRNTPTRVRLTLLGALAYFVMPFDAVADFMPLIGFADDAAVLSAAIVAVGASITEMHREAARVALAGLEGATKA